MRASSIVEMRAGACRPAVLPVNQLVFPLLVAPSQAKVTEGRCSEGDSGLLQRTLLLAGLKEAFVEKGDALGALR